MTRPSWKQYWMFLAKIVASRSTCNSRPVGAILVKDNKIVATGYNGAPAGYEHCIDKGPDYCFRRRSKVQEENKQNICPSVHSEINCLSMASRRGIVTEGSDLYITLSPCLNCSKALVAAGIKNIYYEMLYASKNVELDEYLNESIVRFGIFSFEQVTIKPETYSYILRDIQQFTSTRRLT